MSRRTTKAGPAAVAGSAGAPYRRAGRGRVLAAGLAVAALALTACGSSDDDKPDAAGDQGGGTKATRLEVITSWAPADPAHKVLTDVIKKVEGENPGLKINLVSAGEAVADTVETAFAAGKEPDVAILNLIGKSLDWVKTGQAEPAEKYMQAWGMTDKIKPDALAEWKDPEGKLMGFPYNGFAWPVWYNTKSLKAAGIDSPPTTTDELIAASKALRDKGMQPLVVGGSDWSGNKMFLQIAQSYMSADQAKSVFAKGNWCETPEAVKGIELFTRLRDAGVFSKGSVGFNADQMNSDFYAGGSAMMSAGSWAFAGAPAKLKQDVVLGGLPVPSDGAYSKPTAFQGYTGSGFWVLRNGAKKEELAKKFITAFYTDEVIGRFVTEVNIVPAAQTSAEISAKDPLMTKAVNELSEKVEFAVLPDAYVPARKSDAVTRVTADAYGKGDAQKICSALEKAY